MSKSATSKTAAILIGLSLLAATTFPALAKDANTGAINRRPTVQQNIDAPEGVTATGKVAGPDERVNALSKLGAVQDKLASRAAALKLRLQSFRNQKKAEIAERISNNLNKINQNLTSQMHKLLDTMSTILVKLEARVNEGTPDIKDPASAKVAIASARVSIASASAAISAQALKDYTIQVTTEAKIKTDVKTQRDKLHTDLLVLRKVVIDAKQAVINAIRIAKLGPSNNQATKSGEEKEGTASGQR